MPKEQSISLLQEFSGMLINRTMKKINIKYFFTMALFALMVFGCKDEDFDNYKIQSVDNHGNDQKIISTAATATSNSEFVVNAVSPTNEIEEFNLIPVVLSSGKVASEDIHVTMVPVPDSLDSYNVENETEYLLAGTSGSPAFTLVDGGVVTIPKGSNVGYLKIKAVSFDYLGSNYAFPYRIESVREPGYIISGNHNFGIAVFMAKNDYDGLYHAEGKLEGHPSLSGPIDFKDFEMATSGLNTVIFNAVAGKNAVFGVKVEATIDLVTNKVTLEETSDSAAELAFSDPTNSYDPVKKIFKLKFGWGTRVETLTLTYTDPR
jgi:hypothetical protein